MDVDARVRAASARWQLAVGPRLAGGARSAVFVARDALGETRVLKLVAAGTASTEARALRAWAGSGAAVTLVEATADALLLVHVRPGTPMPWRTGEGADRSVEVAAELLGRLWAPPPGSSAYPTLAEVYLEEERVARADATHEQRDRGEPDRGRPGLLLLPAAAAVADHLIDTTSTPLLLHGDFVSKNLIRDESSATGWVAIDPRPCVGDAAAEVAACAAYHPVEQILPVAEALARRTRVDPERVRRWTAVWAVHQTAQAWRDDQGELEAFVQSPAVTGLLLG